MNKGTLRLACCGVLLIGALAAIFSGAYISAAVCVIVAAILGGL